MPQEEAEEDSYPGHLPASSSARSRLARPLEGELGQLGSLSIYSGTSSRPFGDDDVRAIDDLIRRAVPALDNALSLPGGAPARRHRRPHGSAQPPLLPRDARSASARARTATGGSLALLVLDLDDFKSINERVGHLAGDGVLAEAARRVRAVLRASDIACRVGGDEFAIILPEAGSIRPRSSTSASRRRVVRGADRHIPRLTLSGGVAELAEATTSTTFFERADERALPREAAPARRSSSASTA